MRKILHISDYMLENSNFPLIEEKIDGICFIWEQGTLYSAKRKIERNDRFPHLIESLSNIFPNTIVYGEIAIENGTVYDIMKVENWEKAKFYPFLIKGKNNLLSREILESLSVKFDKNIILPKKFKTLNEGIEYVKEFNKEGLVLKNQNTMFKYKIKKESKCPIKDVIKNKAKYSFVVEFMGNLVKIPCRENKMYDIYCLYKKDNRYPIMCEFEYVSISENGFPIQPVARRIFHL